MDEGRKKNIYNYRRFNIRNPRRDLEWIYFHNSISADITFERKQSLSVFINEGY